MPGCSPRTKTTEHSAQHNQHALRQQRTCQSTVASSRPTRSSLCLANATTCHIADLVLAGSGIEFGAGQCGWSWRCSFGTTCTQYYVIYGNEMFYAAKICSGCRAASRFQTALHVRLFTLAWTRFVIKSPNNTQSPLFPFYLGRNIPTICSISSNPHRSDMQHVPTLSTA